MTEQEEQTYIDHVLKDPIEVIQYAEGALLADANLMIHKALEGAGITQAELARRLQVSRARINKVLNGETNLTIKFMGRIAGALDLAWTLGLEHIGTRHPAITFDRPYSSERMAWCVVAEEPPQPQGRITHEGAA